MQPGPLTPDRGAAAAEAASALHKMWLSSVVDVSWQLTTPPAAEATLAIATAPPPSRNDAVILRAGAIQRTLRRAAFAAALPFEGEYTSTCGKVWCSRGTAGAQAGAVVSLWRPAVPQGYVYFGDFAHPGEKRPPDSAVGLLIAPDGVKLNDGKDLFAKPARFDRVWVSGRGHQSCTRLAAAAAAAAAVDDAVDDDADAEPRFCEYVPPHDLFCLVRALPILRGCRRA